LAVKGGLLDGFVLLKPWSWQIARSSRKWAGPQLKICALATPETRQAARARWRGWRMLRPV